MLDGTDAGVRLADSQRAGSNAVGGATWVSFHHGGVVGIGYSQNAGQVIVADGTPEAARRLERVLTTDRDGHRAACRCRLPRRSSPRGGMRSICRCSNRRREETDRPGARETTNHRRLGFEKGSGKPRLRSPASVRGLHSRKAPRNHCLLSRGLTDVKKLADSTKGKATCPVVPTRIHVPRRVSRTHAYRSHASGFPARGSAYRPARTSPTRGHTT